MSKAKLLDAGMDLAAIADDLDKALADILAAADGDAKADMADDNLYQTAHQLIGQVPLMSSPVDKDSFAIRAHRAIEEAMHKDFRQIAGDAVRKRIMPEHARIQACRERIRQAMGRLGTSGVV